MYPANGFLNPGYRIVNFPLDHAFCIFILHTLLVFGKRKKKKSCQSDTWPIVSKDRRSHVINCVIFKCFHAWRHDIIMGGKIILVLKKINSYSYHERNWGLE